MIRYIIILGLGVALFFSGAWYLGLFDSTTDNNSVRGGSDHQVTEKPEKLGDFLYAKTEFQPIVVPKRKAADPIVLYGVMSAFETQEVPSKVQGTVLFIGDQVDDAAVLAAGSAAFLAEPYYFEPIYAGRYNFVKFYRRHYEGDTIKQGQMLGMMDPPKALGGVLEKIAKIAAAEADYGAAQAAEKEGEERKKRAEDLYYNRNKAIPKEDLGAAILTYTKLMNERVSAGEKIKLAEIEKDAADVELRQHEIRAVLPYPTYTIKSIQRTAGTFVKQLDPLVMTVQNLSRLMAEAAIDEQYAVRLKENMTATIEPTVLEAPIHELPGHTLDITSVAVSKDLKIISGSEDKSVCVWSVEASAPLRKLEHDDAVKVVACSPVGAKENICIAGCADGSIWMWNLDKDEAKPFRDPIVKAHGNEAGITALAFSPDGKYFASGGSDGSIKLWTTEDGALKYAFVPENGVAHSHDDAVTSLSFTPQCRLISAAGDNSLRVWLLKEKGAHLDGKPILNRKGNVRQLGVSRDGQWMLFDQGHMLKMFSVETRKFVYTLNLPPAATPFDTLAIFSPDGSLMLTGGANEGRLQLWSTPNAKSRGYEVRQFATREKLPVNCAAFSPDVGQGRADAFAVSASGHRLYIWAIPTEKEVSDYRIQNVPLTLKTQSIDPTTRQTRVGFEVANPASPQFPNGRFEAGRPVTIVID